MAIKKIEHRGMTATAVAFEVMGLARFVVRVSISRTRARSTDRNVKFFEPPSGDGFFDDPDEGLDSALSYARSIIDGEVQGLTVDDL